MLRRRHKTDSALPGTTPAQVPLISDAQDDRTSE
jgi:hypothetical protein